MRLAILRHNHKHGNDIYISLVDDRATEKDSETIIKAMIKLYGIDYDPEQGTEVDSEGEQVELRFWDRADIKTVKLDFPERFPEKNHRGK